MVNGTSSDVTAYAVVEATELLEGARTPACGRYLSQVVGTTWGPHALRGDELPPRGGSPLNDA